MRLPFVAGLALCISFGIGCRSKPTQPTRDECSKVAEHIAELIIAHYLANPQEWFEAVAAEPGDTELPKEIEKTTFEAFLATEPGKTWLLKRRGQTLSGVQQGIDPCVENATRAQVKCLLAAKSKTDVAACDEKHAKQVAGSAESK
jgi:hypothetical protein